MNPLQKFARDHKAKIEMMSIIGIAIALIVASAVLPTALVTMSNETLFEGADSTVVTLATLVVPIVAVASLVMILLRRR